MAEGWSSIIRVKCFLLSFRLPLSNHRSYRVFHFNLTFKSGGRSRHKNWSSVIPKSHLWQDSSYGKFPRRVGEGWRGTKRRSSTLEKVSSGVPDDLNETGSDLSVYMGLTCRQRFRSLTDRVLMASSRGSGSDSVWDSILMERSRRDPPSPTSSSKWTLVWVRVEKGKGTGRRVWENDQREPS